MNFVRFSFFTLLLLAGLCCPVLRADDLATGFDSANKLYEQGKFADAAAAYDKLLATGNASTALYFNRGNAFLKEGQFGRAIVSYLQAKRLSPRDADLRANLDLARTRARGGVPYQPDRIRELFGKLTLNEWTTLLVIAFWLLFLLLAFAQRRPDLKSALRSYTLAVAVAVVGLGACFAVAFDFDYLTGEVVVIAGEAEVRNGPLEEAPSNFKVRDGAELTILDRKDGWVQVADSSQRIGWLRRDQVLDLQTGGAPK